MMTRQELLAFLERADRVEEGAVESLSTHIAAATRWSGFADAEIARVHEVLRILHDDSIGHREALRALRARVEQEARDVY
jgi:hypothetical protein